METEAKPPFLRTALALWVLRMIGGLAILPRLLAPPLIQAH